MIPVTVLSTEKMAEICLLKSYTNLLDTINLQDIALFFLTFIQNISAQNHQNLTPCIIRLKGITAVIQHT